MSDSPADRLLQALADADRPKKKKSTVSLALVPTGTSWLGMLGLMFIYLKLTGQIAWSWWYVTLPIWGILVLAASIVFAVALVVTPWALFVRKKK